MCFDPGPLGLEERTSIEDLWALWGVFSEGPRKAGLMARIRRHPDFRRPDPVPTPPHGLEIAPAPGGEPMEAYVSEPMSPAEISARRRFEVRLWTGEVIDERGGPHQ